MIRDAGILLNMRVHVSEENVKGLEELIDELQSSVGIGVKSKTVVTVAPVVPTKMCPFYPARCTETVEAADVLTKAWEAAKKSGVILEGMPHPPTEMLPCPYTTPTSVIVDPDGILYKCLMAAQEGVSPVGSVSKGIVSSEPFSGPDTLWEDRCTQCQFLVLCGSGCAWRRRVHTETACEGTRRLLTERLKFYVKNEHPL
jgi:radical SAM protein with 4Fe4S-binding SPASM domain